MNLYDPWCTKDRQADSAVGVYVSERLEREKLEEERRHLEEMSEDEYDALSDQQKADVDRQRLEIKKRRLQRLSSCMYCQSCHFSVVDDRNNKCPK